VEEDMRKSHKTRLALIVTQGESSTAWASGNERLVIMPSVKLKNQRNRSHGTVPNEANVHKRKSLSTNDLRQKHG
jgi:hypothetical protein